MRPRGAEASTGVIPPVPGVGTKNMEKDVQRKSTADRVRLGDIQYGDLSTNIVVRKGDLIVVPPTILARIGYAFQMLLFPLQPLISGATAAGSIASGSATIRAATN